MSTAEYLADTSALAQIMKEPAVAGRWEMPIQAGLVGVCPVTELELLYSATSAANRTELVGLLASAYSWVPMPDRVYSRAWEVQGALTARGTHRSAGAVDLVVAAVAELQKLTLLHHDHDFERIAEVTGQPLQWLDVPR